MRVGSSALSFVLMGVIAMMSCGEPKAEKIRKSVLAGTWYEGTEAGLRAEVDGFLAKVPPIEPGGRVLGLISPHAGYFYSGQAAAYGYAQIQGTPYHRVVVIAPSHRIAFHGISIPDVTHYETPLGRVPLDVKRCRQLRAASGFSSFADVHAREHSLEIQLPFLQRVLGEFELVPMVVGEIREDEYADLASAIADIVDEGTLVVASSDFTHYGSRFGYLPFSNDVKENLENLDMGAVDFILKKDRKGFLEYRAKTQATICGAAPIALLIDVMPKDTVGRLLTYYTSGDVTEDWDNSVSYVSMAFYGPNGGEARERKDERTASARPEDESLSVAEQETLLNLARETLETYARTKKTPEWAEDDPRLTPLLKSERGVFVTLKKKGQLRGCIGHIIPRLPLYRGVMENAFNAGWRDHRFPPLQRSEMLDLEIEISVLTPPRRVSSPQDIVIGKHGVIIEKGHHSAVYLPQVAPEQGWDVEETLTHLSMKAGLPPDGWNQGATFSVFSAEVFGEK